MMVSFMSIIILHWELKCVLHPDSTDVFREAGTEYSHLGLVCVAFGFFFPKTKINQTNKPTD